jgi:hypothetical protein
MGTRHHIAAGGGIVLLAAAFAAGLAPASQTPGAPVGVFNARGTSDPFQIRDKATGLKITARQPVDAAIVGAELPPGGETGWHLHPADSIVVVKPDAPPLTMLTQRRGRCVKRTFQPGQAFVHPARPHNFVNYDTARPLGFGVCYIVPVGAILLTPSPAPAGCSR